MNDRTLPGPCAGYEFEIVELHEGSLGPIDAARVRAHLEACPRCREWQARHASLDAALARALPRPALDADFGAMLSKRLEGLADSRTRHDLRAAAEREHDWAVRALRRRARQRAIAAACAGATIATAIIALVEAFGPKAAMLLQSSGTLGLNGLLGALGAAAVVGSLAWSATRGVLPGVRVPG